MDEKKLTPPEKIARLFSEYYPNIQRNEINGEFEIEGKALSQFDHNSILLEFQTYKRGINEDLYYKFLNSNNTPSFNPIRNFFERSKDNFSNGHIEKLAATITTSQRQDKEYRYFFLKKWLVGTVAMVYHTGINPLILVLTGEIMGIGKTEWIRRLLPPELKRFLAEPKGASYRKDQELAMMLSENLILFDDELAGRSMQDINAMKALTSSETVTVRRPYAKRQEKYRRIASFAASSNEQEVIKDPAGNRRIVPFHVESINFAKYNSINKKDVWHEAYKLYKEGFNHDLTRDEIDYLNSSTTEFVQIDAVEELINEKFDPPTLTGESLMSATEVAREIAVWIPNDRSITPERVGRVLKRLGYIQDRRDSLRKYKISRKLG